MTDKIRVLVVDDERGLAEAIGEGLERAGFECSLAFSGAEGIRRIESDDPDIVLTDLRMGEIDGLDLVRRAKAKSADTEVIVITGYPAADTAYEALDEGAYWYIPKPVDVKVLRDLVRRAAEKQGLFRSNVELRRQIDRRYGFEGIVGNSEKMLRAVEIMRQVAASNATVLITGESGTGKELVARAIHNNSPRRGRHFVPLNCAALSESILESELFGHVKGAFTGASYDRKGRFEYAAGGTLFLDEIGDLPPATQVKLLRVIENREIIRVGSNDPVKVDVRLLSATNRDLAALVKEGTFREDLYFRLKVVTIDLPPLRERLDDLPALAQAFLKEFAEAHNKKVASVSPAAMQMLCQYRWPGNIRQLRNCVEHMVVITRDEILDVDDIPDYVKSRPESAEEESGVGGLTTVNLESAEKELIRQALAIAQGNREKAAEMLGIGERTLYRKIKRYGLL